MFRARYRGQGYATGFGGYQPGFYNRPVALPPQASPSAVAAAAPRMQNEYGPPVQPRFTPPPGSTPQSDPMNWVFLGRQGPTGGWQYVPGAQSMPPGMLPPDAQFYTPPSQQNGLYTGAAPATRPATGAVTPGVETPPTGAVTPGVQGGLPQPAPTPSPRPAPGPAPGPAQTNTGIFDTNNTVALPPDEFGQPQYQTADGIVHVVDPTTGIELGQSPWPVANPTAPSNQWRPAGGGEEPNLTGAVTPGVEGGLPQPAPMPTRPVNDVEPMFNNQPGTPQYQTTPYYRDYPAPIPTPTRLPAPPGGGTYSGPVAGATQGTRASESFPTSTGASGGPAAGYGLPAELNGPALGDQTMPPASTPTTVLGAPYTITPAPTNPYAPYSPFGDQTYPPSQYPAADLGPPGWDFLDPTLPIPTYPDPYAVGGGGGGNTLT